MWHPIYLNIHIEHLSTDIGDSHSGKVALKLRKFEDRLFRIRNTRGKSALSPVGSGSRISQVLNADGRAFQDYQVDWSVLRKLLVIANQAPCRKSRGWFHFIFHEESHLPDHSTLKNSGLEYQEQLTTSSSLAHTQHPLVIHKVPLWPGQPLRRVEAALPHASQEAICAISRDVTLFGGSTDGVSKGKISLYKRGRN